MENDQLDPLTLDLFFDNDVSLSQIAETLKDVDDAYRACLAVVAPEAVLDPGVGGPSIVIRTGSLFVQLAGAFEPGVWVGSAILLMRFMLNNAPEVAALPQHMREKYREHQALADKHKKIVHPLWKRKPIVGQDAIDRALGRFARPKKSNDSPAVSQNSSNSTDANLSDLPSGTGASIQTVRETVSRTIDSAERVAVNLMQFSSQVDLLRSNFASSMKGSNSTLVGDAIAALGSAKKELDGSIGILHVVKSPLHEYLKTLES